MALERRCGGLDQRPQVLGLRTGRRSMAGSASKKRSAPRSMTASSTPSLEPK